MARNRLTNRRAPARNNERKAAQPPASYDWTPEHPAYDQPDPEVDQYLIDNDGNGTGSEPSDFNEDIHEGPYENSGHPATPGEEEEGHPAAKAASRRRRAAQRRNVNRRKQAFLQRKAAERKAAKCIRIAQNLLGPSATVEAIEDQAVDLMDLPDVQIDSTLDRLSTSFLADQNDPAGDTLAPMGEPAIQACGDEVVGMDDDVEALLAAMLEEEANAELADDDAAEALLAEMLEEGPEEALLAEMIEEEAILATEETNTNTNPVTETVSEAVSEAAENVVATEEVNDGELGLEMLAEDPMGLTAEETQMDDLLAELYGGKFAAKKAEEDEAEDEEEEEKEEEEEEKEASKKASKRTPKPRKASKGPKTIGTVTKTAANELSELAALWESAPDVSGFFDS